MRKHDSRRIALSLIVAGIVSSVTLATEPLFYVVDGEAIVFTNERREGAQVVPGFTETGGAGARPQLPPTVFDPHIDKVARDNGLSPELIKAVALVESGFNPRAVSHAGAQGLMQLMPATAADYGVEDAFDPESNLQAGAQHLRKLLDRYDGDLALALAAYNAGEGAVQRYDGVPNYPETRNYVRKVHEKLGRTPPPGLEAPKKQKPVGYRILEDGTILISNED